MLEPNEKLRLARQQKHWSQERAAAEIGIDRKTYVRWENGQNYPQPGTLELACNAFGLPAEDLGFTGIFTPSQKFSPVISLLTPLSAATPKGVLLKVGDGLLEESLTREYGMGQADTGIYEGLDRLSVFHIGVTEKLDHAESIINLAWEAWFASRPGVVSRSVNKLLPGLEKIAYSLCPPGQALRAKELAIRAHGLLGSVCLDALHNDTALFHYMQAHRFAEELHDSDQVTTYLCLVGEVLRRQKDEIAALSHMENARTQAARASKATQGHILQLLAYTYGDTGQEVAFERAISEATDLLAFSGEGRDISQKEFIPFEVYEIRGKINRDLGKPMNALPYLDLAEESLVAADTVVPRWYALLEISRAQAYCDAGDFATGIDLACKGLLKAYQCRSSYQMNRVRKLLRKLEQSLSRNHPGVQDLKNLLYETYMRMDNEDVG